MTAPNVVRIAILKFNFSQTASKTEVPSQAAARVKRVKKSANQFARGGRVAKTRPKTYAERMDVRLGRVIGVATAEAVG